MTISSYAFSQNITTSEITVTPTNQPQKVASQEKVAKESKLNVKVIERPKELTRPVNTPAQKKAQKEVEIKKEK